MARTCTDLPAGTSAARRIELANADVILIRGALPAPERQTYLNVLLAEVDWRQETVKLFGRAHLQPRLTAWYGDGTYRYSGVNLTPRPWTPALSALKALAEHTAAAAGVPAAFNSVLLNLYRDGNDGVGWHADNEPSLGRNPVIASLSLGATRRFHLRHRDDATEKTSIDLCAGDILIMAGPTQHYWQHRLAKTRRDTGPRVNLTFREIKSDSGENQK